MVYHGENKAKGGIFLYSNDAKGAHEKMMHAPGVDMSEILHYDTAIYPEADSYTYWCINLAGALGVDPAVPRHVVGFEAIINPLSAKYVHHFLIYGFESE